MLTSAGTILQHFSECHGKWGQQTKRLVKSPVMGQAISRLEHSELLGVPKRMFVKFWSFVQNSEIVGCCPWS
jgi:hypothetical protein